MASGLRRRGDALDRAVIKVMCWSLNPEGGGAALRRFARFAGPGHFRAAGWIELANFVALLATIPVAIVFGFVFAPAEEIWQRLTDRVLAD